MSVINATPLLAAAGGDYQISRSVRLRSSASAYFNRTPASAGNRKTWTWSGWVKVGTLGVNRGLFGAQTTAGNDNNRLLVWLNSSNKIIVYEDIAGTGNTYRLTTQVFRDPSAWYHVVLAFDTSNATAADRVKLYVNGSQITAFDTNNAPTLNRDTFVNATLSHSLGADRASSLVVFDGYLTEVNFIDGQALTPSSFGETNPVTGVWQPKKYAGTYGTNGFYLNFSDNSAATAAAIGKDSSGNGNNWTPNNISVTAGATYDSMLDVPTLYADGGNGRGNYAVLNPLWKDTTSTINNANLTFSGGNYAGLSTLVMGSGKWYFEATVTTATSTMYVSITEAPFAYGGNINLTNGGGAYSYSYYSNGTKWVLGANSAYGASWGTVGDVIGAALDLDASTITFYRNNVSQGSISIAAGKSWVFGLSNATNTGAIAANFGQRPFAYTPPTGFKALNTQNLPEPTIKKGNQYFDATTYTGNGSTQSIVNAGGFQPDLVWGKARSLANSNFLVDAVRGSSLFLSSDQTIAEVSNSSLVSSLNSNGYTVGNTTTANQNAATYVGWQWKEGAQAGFDIVTGTTPTSGGFTVAHSLGVVPAMVIFKRRSNTSSWGVWHKGLSSGTHYVLLDSTAAQVNDSTVFSATPTSTVANLGSAWAVTGAQSYVGYLFAEVPGFSRFGSYTGNGSTDGPFVFCGFRPAFVMVKRTDSTSDWYSRDSTRDTYNPINNTLFPNTSAAEEGWAGAYPLDLTSNGFKLRTSVAGFNASGGTFIYMAFAENPFKNSLAR